MTSRWFLPPLLMVFGTAGAAPPRPAAPAAPAAANYSGHGVSSVPPEVLAKFAPTPVPPELSRRIQTMLDLRSPGGGQLSPDGRRLYFTWNVTGVAQVWRLDGPQKFPVQMTGGEDATTLADITPDGKYLVLSRDRRGEENPGLYLQSPDGGTLRLIQHKGGIQTHYFFVSDDSRYVYFGSNDITPDSYAIYRYDITTQARELVFGEKGLWEVADRQKDGRLLLFKSTGSLSREYYEYDPAQKKLVPLLGQNEKEEYRASYSAQPGELLVLTAKFGEFRRLYRYRGGDRFDPISPDIKSDVDNFDIDDTRQHVLYTINDGGFTRLKALDARTFAPLELPAFAGADHVRPGRLSADGRQAIVVVDTAKAPPVSYVYDWRTRKLTQWVMPSAPEVDTTRFATATLETYPARDGARIPMLVRRPERCDDGPCPVVVHFHGGPESQSRPGFSPRAQLFVDAGFVFIEPNVRGSEGYGKSWLKADDGPRRLDVITDIEDCAKYVRQAFAKDGKTPKVGIFGGSYGGYSVLVGMTMFAGAYDAGVSVVGISSLLTFLKNTAPYRRILRTTEYGDPDKDAEALRKLSPTTYIDRLNAPLLIIQGGSDPRVPVGEALQMHNALESRKIPSPLIIFADEGHGARKRDNRVLEIGHTLEFFQTHLKPKTTPATASR
jgi:dipeptidyl aminopeptidase/acylaminoacyl peptidase